MEAENKFIADVHLGKLAKLLRLLGFDTAYKNSFTNEELPIISEQQNRIILTRNKSLYKNNLIKSFLITSEDPMMQLKAVVTHFHLHHQFHFFTRCLVCNGILKPVSKNNILPLLQQNTITYFNEFWQCTHCKHIYWKGSHYERMLKTIEQITC